MITEQALSSIEWLFERSVHENSLVDAEDTCTVNSLADASSAIAPENAILVALNIASYAFRIVILTEFKHDHSTIALLAKILKRPENELEGQVLHDACAEFVNILCGTVNRKLCTEFKHIGMSTPFFIDAACASYLSVLNPAAIRSLAFRINESAQFKLLLCVCVDKASSIDFSIDRTVDEDVATGALELF